MSKKTAKEVTRDERIDNKQNYEMMLNVCHKSDNCSKYDRKMAYKKKNRR